ncbi:MAG TPA: glycosyltransferase [Patescibacteria group bacterium]
MPKRIALISYHTCPLAAAEGKETGGMNIYILSTAKELAKAGYTIDIFTRSQDPKQQHIINLAERLRVIHIPAGPEVEMLPNSEENKKKFREYLPEFIKNIQTFQQQKKIVYDLIDAHYYLSGLAGLELQNTFTNSKTIPLIMTFHTLALMKNLTSFSSLTEQEKARIQAEFLLTSKAQLIISPSSNEQKYLQYLYNVPPEKIAVVAPGVDTKLFHPQDKQQAKKAIGADLGHKMILFVGRIEPVKGIEVLIYAVKILLQHYPQLKACLWIVGGDTSQNPQLWPKHLHKLEELRQLLNLHTTVKFVGQKQQHELPNYYNAADLVVMPSHYESFGLAALEAMACGTPVITTNVTGISNLFDENSQKYITVANNPLILAEDMAEIILHHDAQIDQEMYNMIKEYDWEKVTQKLSNAYGLLK